MPGLIGEVLLPAFEKHYGFRLNSPEIEFFTEHDAADVEHSRRQIELCGRYLDTPQFEARPSRWPRRSANCAGPRSPSSIARKCWARRKSYRRGSSDNLRPLPICPLPI